MRLGDKVCYRYGVIVGRGIGLYLGLSAVLVGACGPGSAILVEVNSGRAIPTEVDRLQVVAFAGTAQPQTDPDLGTADFVLESDATFPLVVLFEPLSGTPEQLFLQVTLLLDNVPVEGIAVVYDWRPGQVTEVSLPTTEPLL